MKRLHVHMAVDDLERAAAFYAGLFGAPPTVRTPNYVEWVLDDPPVNFAASLREDDATCPDRPPGSLDNGGEPREAPAQLQPGEDLPATEGSQMRGSKQTGA